MANLVYTYDEMIARSEEISLFSGNFKKEIDYLSEKVVKKMRSNLISDDANRVYGALDKIKADEDEIQAAIDKFAIAIREDIAPAYKAVEQNLEADTTGVYGQLQ
jgi:hypothetical protein